MEPLRELWLNNADIETLLDPEARPATTLTKLWATPIAWAAGRRRDETVDTLVEQAAREEVRSKLSRFIRSRWLESPDRKVLVDGKRWYVGVGFGGGGTFDIV